MTYYEGIKKKTSGRDYNFYAKYSVSGSTFDFVTDGYCIVDFPNYGLILTNENTDGAVVEYSFNGVDTHGELIGTAGNPTRQLTFLQRQVSLIFFRVKSGSSGPITLRIDAW